MSTGNQSNTIQAFWIGIGSLFSFGFAIVSSIILSRYFLKEDYGTFKQVLYVFTTLSTIFALGLPKAFSYFLPRVDEAQAKSVISKLTKLFLVLGLIFSLSLYFFSGLIADALKNPELETALKIFSPVPLFMLPTKGLEGVLATYKKTKFLAIYTVSTNLMQLTFVAIPVVLFGFGYEEALIGFVISSFIAFLLALYLKYMPVRNKGNDVTELKYREIFQFSLPLLWASLWGLLISSADQFFISRYFGNKVFAEFSNGAIELPFVGMVIGATSKVLSPVFSGIAFKSKNAKKEILPLWISVFEKSAKLIYPLLLYTWFFADVLIITLYGEHYINSAVYFRIKAVLNFFTLIVYGPLLINTGKLKYYANVHMITAVALIILEYISVKTIDSPYALITISMLCQLGKTIALLYASAKFFQIKMIHLFPIKLLMQIVLFSVVVLGIEYYVLVICLKLNYLLVLILSFIIYIALYAVYVYIAKIDYFSILKPFFNKIKR